jgi:4-amino-4-deoxy-L-arabinose transferase-like glycosyltransferase
MMDRRLVGRSVAALVLALIVAYGAVLRLDALFDTFGPYTRPSWVAAVQPAVASLDRIMPAWRWPRDETPYERGDPINYLRFAREMQSFYQPHVREPVYLASVRAALWFAGDEDVGISLASIFFSLLLVVATYLLGAHVLSRPAGLVAAGLMAIERDVVALSFQGWRDEAFAAFGILAAWLWLRVADKQTTPSAVAAGVMTGIACLTRLTAPFMLVPAVVWVAAVRDAAERRRRLRLIAIGGAVAAVLVAPYLIRCAITFGDPLYAINYHTGFYLGRAGEDPEVMNAGEYVRNRWLARPIYTTDVAFRGLFMYPFEIKWRGLNAWQAGFGTFVAWLAAAGLASWLWSARGRFLVAVLLGSLVPYMITWPIRGGGEWRFTIHAYPIYLIAALSAVGLAFATIRRASGRGAIPWRRAGMRVAVTAGVLVFGFGWWWGMPFLVARETVMQERPIRIGAGRRDRVFFGSDWTALSVSGEVTSRFSTALQSNVRLPLRPSRDHDLELRIDPVPLSSGSPSGHVRVSLNGHPVTAIDLTYDPRVVGSYKLRLPREHVRAGSNVLGLAIDHLVETRRVRRTFRALAAPAGSIGLRFWYLVVTPVSDRPPNPIPR